MEETVKLDKKKNNSFIESGVFFEEKEIRNGSFKRFALYQ